MKPHRFFVASVLVAAVVGGTGTPQTPVRAEARLTLSGNVTSIVISEP